MPRLIQRIMQKNEFKKSRVNNLGSLSIQNILSNKLSLMVMCLSLFLVGSCNESSNFLDFSRKPNDLKVLTKSELVRYGFAIQIAMLQKSDNINKFNADEIKLALSEPDLKRHDGSSNVWQYQTDSCVLDIYWNQKSNSKPVSFYEIRQRRSILDGTQAVIDPVQWQCLQTIIQERRQSIEKGFNETYAALSL